MDSKTNNNDKMAMLASNVAQAVQQSLAPELSALTTELAEIKTLLIGLTSGDSKSVRQYSSTITDDSASASSSASSSASAASSSASTPKKRSAVKKQSDTTPKTPAAKAPNVMIKFKNKCKEPGFIQTIAELYQLTQKLAEETDKLDNKVKGNSTSLINKQSTLLWSWFSQSQKDEIKNTRLTGTDSSTDNTILNDTVSVDE